MFIYLDYYTRLCGDRQPFTSKIRTLNEGRVHNEQKHYYSFSKALSYLPESLPSKGWSGLGLDVEGFGGYGSVIRTTTEPK